MYYSTTYLSPVGTLTLGGDGEHLVGVWLDGQKYFGGAVAKEFTAQDGLPVFSTTRDWLDRYFAGEKPSPSELPLHPIGGEFRQQVWRLLCQIPYGEITTYGTLAKNWRPGWAGTPCPVRRWVERWAITPSPSSSLSPGRGANGALPDMPGHPHKDKAAGA